MILTDQFETLCETKVGLMDPIASAVWHFKRLKRGIENDHYSDADTVTIFDHVQMGLVDGRAILMT